MGVKPSDHPDTGTPCLCRRINKCLPSLSEGAFKPLDAMPGVRDAEGIHQAAERTELMIQPAMLDLIEQGDERLHCFSQPSILGSITSCLLE